MKYFKAVLKYAAIAYALGSLALSVAVSSLPNGSAKDFLIEHRAPFLVHDFSIVTDTRIGYGWDINDNPEYDEPDELTFGYTRSGDLVGFWIGDYPEGQNLLTLNVYNPFTNWDDDVSARFDLFDF